MAKKLDLTKERIERLCLDYRNGAILNDLAEQLSCCSGTVSRILRAEGVILRGKGRRSKIGEDVVPAKADSHPLRTPELKTILPTDPAKIFEKVNELR